MTNQIQNVRSESRPINASIPQGSVIGCLLFLVYINDFPKFINEPCILFADDISLIISCLNKFDLQNKIHSILEKTVSWLSEHNLDVNFSKTKIMTFHPRQKHQLDISCKYKDEELELVPHSHCWA